MVNLAIKDTVEDLLKRFPHLRDSDEKLVANIWHSSIRKLGGANLSAFEFLQIYANGNIPNSESITRCRRKIQEENPELRGKNYQERQEKQETIKEELGYIRQIEINWSK